MARSAPSWNASQGSNAWLALALREGKNREVRRVLEHLGLPVTRLIRLSYGPFQLGHLERGCDRGGAEKGARASSSDSRGAQMGRRMRIVGGRHRGRRLSVAAGRRGPPDQRPRPRGAVQHPRRTADFAEAGLPFADAVVLDAFAGTGALGLEALSRGAAEAVFIESDRDALPALRRNVASLGETAPQPHRRRRRHPAAARGDRLRRRLSRPALSQRSRRRRR